MTAALADLIPSGTSTLGMPREAWLAARLYGVGASETPTLLGFGYGDETPLSLYLRKVGKLPPIEESEAMRLGTRLEPAIVDHYADRVGVAIRDRQVFVHHPAYPRAFATLDAVREDGRPVEVKVVGADAARQWKGEADGLDAVPSRVLAQMAHQILASGAEAVDLAALIGGTDLRVWTLTRDEASRSGTIDRIAGAVAEFAGRLDRCDPPPAVIPVDAGRLVHVHEAAEGSILLEGDAAAEAAKFLDLGRQVRELEALKEASRAAVLAAMGGAALAELPDGRLLSRRVEHRKERVQKYAATTFAVLAEKKRKGADRGEE